MTTYYFYSSVIPSRSRVFDSFNDQSDYMECKLAKVFLVLEIRYTQTAKELNVQEGNIFI